MNVSRLGSAGYSTLTLRAPQVHGGGCTCSCCLAATPIPVSTGPATPGVPLSDEQKQVAAQLKKRDAEVRLHEQAHIAASGGLAGSPSYSFQRGPDGQSYAVAGEVKISLREGHTPEETVQLARKVRAAALAPSDPSGQDRAVAAQAAQMEQDAQARIAQDKLKHFQANNPNPGTEAIEAVSRYGAAGVGGFRIDLYA